MADYRLRPATGQDAAAIALIYNQGIEDRLATLETELRTADERRQWLERAEPAPSRDRRRKRSNGAGNYLEQATHVSSRPRGARYNRAGAQPPSHHLPGAA